MIFQFFFDQIFGLILGLISFLPTISLPSTEINTAVNTFFGYFTGINFFIDVNIVSICFTAFFVYYAVKFSFALFNFTIRKIPSIS